VPICDGTRIEQEASQILNAGHLRAAVSQDPHWWCNILFFLK
jgi:hypothetical protein